MTFAVKGDAYDRFMGRYSRELAPRFADFARIEAGMRVLDVGCGPGPLTTYLAERVGSERVSAVDPSPTFVAACAATVPSADVRQGEAEDLPWDDGAFDAALAQLVVNFMRDAERGVSEMRRVVRAGGVVSACTWDYGAGMRMLRAFWDAARTVDADAPDEGRMMQFRTPDALEELWRRVGLADVETASLEVETTYESFDELWEPITTGVGPAGAYYVSLDPTRQVALRDQLHANLNVPAGPFTLRARASAVRGIT